MRTPSALLSALLIAPLAACSASPAPREPVATLSGEATWRWSFDDGSACSYTRSVTATEDRSAPWLIPAGELYRASVTLDGADCAQRVGVGTAPAVEHHGLDDTGWWRGGLDAPLFVLAHWDDGAQRVASYTSEPVDLGGEGAASFEVTAELTLGEGRGDPMHGLQPPDEPSCGWSLADAPAYDGPQELREGQELPDAVFADACGEGVRLHQLTGRYLVVDLAAMDCGPCQAMAEGEGAFRAELSAQGVGVDTVTLLAPSLVEPTTAASAAERAAWAELFDLHGPVLGDRSWGAVVVAEALGDAYSYPSWIVVAPDRTVLAVRGGFGGWDEIGDLILADARAR